MPRSQVSSGFFRIQMLVVVGLAVLAALTIGQLIGGPSTVTSFPSEQTSTIVCWGIAVFGFLGSAMWTLERRKAGTALVFLICVTSSSLLLLTACSLQSLSSLSRNLNVLSELSAASLLGSALTGMLLGHWYLTAPTMSLAPLSRLTMYFGIATIIRLIVSLAGLILAWDQLAGSTMWIWMGLRWLAGILGPILVFVMVWQILKYRNTQSATGVLFVAVILTFIGEMTASLLFQEIRQPI